MPARYRVVILDSARRDLENAFAYIFFDLSDSFAAYRFYDGIMEKVASLEVFPLGYSEFDFGAWRGLGFRRIHYKRYTIIYRVNEAERTVYITNIIYSRRDFSRLAPGA
ncbi:type II toxin-antitoxin system RelE/ParE family toxin [Candidatus Saccharibacteria bacterium]|nr:type II toxin-antitoxin system RelE/ParE family toxin [Candidatus Saccharibacteria bacterium]MBQ9017053.1 type II toxin-antitoxin system RelE/ParE family toxin [Candidatus Saccharibacteria bacterium]